MPGRRGMKPARRRKSISYKQLGVVVIKKRKNVTIRNDYNAKSKLDHPFLPYTNMTKQECGRSASTVVNVCKEYRGTARLLSCFWTPWDWEWSRERCPEIGGPDKKGPCVLPYLHQRPVTMNHRHSLSVHRWQLPIWILLGLS